MRAPDTSKLTLNPAVHNNSEFLNYELWLLSALDLIPQWRATFIITDATEELHLVEHMASEELRTLNNVKMKHWELQRESISSLSEKTKLVNNGVL